MSVRTLTLTAADAEDLAVISAQLQDAVARVGDLVYLPRQRRFAALFNRFKWEARESLRVRSGLYFDGVLAARSRNLKRDTPYTVVSLLAIRFTPQDGKAQEDVPCGCVELLFSGDGAIALDVECIDAGLRDVSGPWTARARPQHERPVRETGGR